MAVGRHRNGPWPGVALLDHDLVADSAACGIEVDAMLLREVFDRCVLLQVRFALVLYVVVQRHDNLSVVVDLGCANGHELRGDREGVVVGHALFRLFTI